MYDFDLEAVRVPEEHRVVVRLVVVLARRVEHLGAEAGDDLAHAVDDRA